MRKPRCGAKTRRGTARMASAIWSVKSKRFTRCKSHGGMSTGPKTAEGIERIRRAVTKHGGMELCRLALQTILESRVSRDELLQEVTSI